MAFNLFLGLLDSGTAAKRPTAPEVPAGFCLYHATDTGVVSMYDGSAWTDITAGNVTNVTGTYTAPVKAYQLLYLDKASGFVVTLPGAVGSGNIIEMVVKTTLTSGAYEVSCAGSDTLAGTIVASKGTTPTPYQATLGTTVNATLTYTTVGAGIKGDYLRFKDIATNVWEVQGNTWVSGTVATPFS